MPDHAVSADPAVQAQLDRLWALSPGADVLGLGRITALLARLGDPHLRLPPVFHVAGTNGKGSTCAFLRAALEAAGHRVHVYSSPHLVRFNERIRVAGTLIDDPTLAALLAEVLDQADGIGASFFEVTTAAAFLHFARVPADACVIEVGLGGRLDATNVIAAPLVCGIAALGIDHQAFLGDTLVEIAGEKAGIAKPGIPLVTMAYPPAIAAAVDAVAHAVDAPVLAAGRDWHHSADADAVHVGDGRTALTLPRPSLAGRHQADNLALAAAMLGRQSALHVPPEAIAAAATGARWPARMQRLREGSLVHRLPPARRRLGIWLDGAHNESAALEVAQAWDKGTGAALVLGMLANKDAEAVLRALLADGRACMVVAVPVPGHAHHDPADLVRIALESGAAGACVARTVADAFDRIEAMDGVATVLIAGSLYLAGAVLDANDERPA